MDSQKTVEIRVSWITSDLKDLLYVGLECLKTTKHRVCLR